MYIAWKQCTLFFVKQVLEEIKTRMKAFNVQIKYFVNEFPHHYQLIVVHV